MFRFQLYLILSSAKFLRIAILFLLASCSDSPQTQTSSNLQFENSNSGNQTVIYEEFSTTLTIRDVMNTLIDPNADALWSAVRYEIDENGTREFLPEDEEDWETLRRQAIAIIEGANALMIPGRLVAPPGSTTEFPDFEYLPEEVETKLLEDRQAWIGFAQYLQETTFPVLEAIESRDVIRLSERSGIIDEACEACHSQYWYRTF